MPLSTAVPLRASTAWSSVSRLELTPAWRAATSSSAAGQVVAPAVGQADDAGADPVGHLDRDDDGADPARHLGQPAVDEADSRRRRRGGRGARIAACP